MLPYEWGGGPETDRGRSRLLRVIHGGGAAAGAASARCAQTAKAQPTGSHGQACLPNMATDGSALRTPPVPRGNEPDSTISLVPTSRGRPGWWKGEAPR
jgi:hypothetical protein